MVLWNLYFGGEDSEDPILALPQLVFPSFVGLRKMWYLKTTGFSQWNSQFYEKRTGIFMVFLSNTIQNLLVVRNIFIFHHFSIDWVSNHPNWPSYFFRGVAQHQPVFLFKKKNEKSYQKPCAWETPLGARQVIAWPSWGKRWLRRLCPAAPGPSTTRKISSIKWGVP